MESTVTIEKLNHMKLYGMAIALRAAVESGTARNSTPEEFLAHLVESEWEDKHQRRTERLMRNAKFRTEALIGELDWTVQRGLDKALMLRLSDCRFVQEHRTIIVTGPTGVGKSFIAQALGSQACDVGFDTAYFNCGKLFPLLREKRIDGSYARFVKSIAKTDLVVFDDFGLLRLDTPDRLSLLEILEDRYARNATIIASQLPVAQWHEVIGDQTIADAICDRVVHHAIRIELNGISMRSKYAPAEKDS
jgi:DNA replication protein DnaC